MKNWVQNLLQRRNGCFFGVSHQVLDPLRFHEKMLLQRLKFENCNLNFLKTKKKLWYKNKVFGVGGCQCFQRQNYRADYFEKSIKVQIVDIVDKLPSTIDNFIFFYCSHILLMITTIFNMITVVFKNFAIKMKIQS